VGCLTEWYGSLALADKNQKAEKSLAEAEAYRLEGFGKTRPVASNDTATGRRRIGVWSLSSAAT